jgi:hypothetical protein
MATRMQQRKGTAAQWISTNAGDGPVLNAGEIGFELDTNKFKIGDGVNHWVDLTYFTDSASALAAINAVIDAAPAALNTLNELAAAINDDPAFFTTMATNLSTHEADTMAVHGIVDTAALATKTYADTAVSNHHIDTTEVHGIADTTALATKTYADGAVSTHSSDTTNVHGIVDTADLATKSYADTAEADAITAAGTAADTKISTHNSDTTDVHGIPNTADLATKAYADGAVSTHSSDTTSVHGIADTSLLAIASTVASDIASAVSTHNLDTTEVHGIADTSLIVTTTGTQTLTNKTITSAVMASPIIANLTLADSSITFEGSSNDTNETIITATDPTADRTIILPDASGTFQLRVADVSDTEIGYLNGVTSAIQTQLDAKSTESKTETLTNKTLTSPVINTPTGITKSDVGLSNVDNTSDANKPVSTATQTALDAKAPLASPTFTGTVNAAELILSGDLTVNGTTTTINSTTLAVDDKNIVIGDVATPSDVTADGGGITLKGATDKTFNWVDATDSWTSSEHINLASGKDLKVNGTAVISSTAGGFIFTDGTQTLEGVPSRTPIVQKTASYTLSSLTERDNLIEMSSASAITLSIPTDATLNYPIGTSIDILQTGAGQVTIAAVTPGTTTVNATPGLKLRTTWSSCTLFKRASDTWVVYGDLTA